MNTDNTNPVVPMNSTESAPVTENTPLPVTPPQNVQPVVPGTVPYLTMPPSPKKPPREYSVKENIYAWLSFFLAYLFTLSIPINSNPLGLLVVIILMYAVSTIVILIKGKKPQLMPILVGVSAVIVSTSLILTSNQFLHFFTYLYSMVAYCYYIYGLSSEHKFRFSDSTLIDFVKALFVLPFNSFSDMFVSMFSGKANKGGRFILKLLLGFAVAIIPTMIIFALLSYDKGFSEIIEKIFNFEDFNLIKHIFKLFLALPLGAYAYGIYISSVDKKCENVLTPDSCKKTMVSMRFAPTITVLAFILPILFMYVVFFISQWKYYVSGFTGVLPKGFSYAEYAREGFFQLCTVSVINLIILVAISLFLKRKEDKPSILLKVISVVFSVSTLVLISTALAKMVMYINCYGLTPKRVYATWLMVVLALVFVMIIVKQFVKRLKLIALSMAVLVLMFTALSLSGVESFIARYNIDSYLDGSLSTVDVEALIELGDPAIPSMVSVYEVLLPMPYDEMNDIEKDLYFEVRNSLINKGIEFRNREAEGENDIWSFTLPSLRAEQALDKTPFYDMK